MIDIKRIALLFVIVLSACSTDFKPENYQQQRDYFLQSIEFINQAGKLLQKQGASQAELELAMSLLDQSMASANAVERDFLKWIDEGLYHAFFAYLLKGIEEYRLGVELGERPMQFEGVEKLQKWWDFWQLKQRSVLEQLDAQ